MDDLKNLTAEKVIPVTPDKLIPAKNGLFFFNYSGFIGQSNFDLGSSGGPLAYMRNNVLVRGALRRVFRDLAKREPRYFSGLVAGD